MASLPQVKIVLIIIVLYIKYCIYALTLLSNEKEKYST